jgi:hypothetical protein
MKYLLILLTLFCSGWSLAEQKTAFGEYDLHYNTFESTFLTPKIASEYGFTRSKGQALLNVAVTQQQAGQLPKPTPAIVSGTVTNLLGQIVTLRFVTIDEGNAIYYIAPFTKTDDDILKFAISARLNADASPMTVNFQRHFYVDK